MASAAAVMPRTYSTRRPNAAAIWPTSSLEFTSTCWSRSPSATPSAAFRTARTPTLMRRATKSATAEPTSRAMINTMIVVRRAETAVACSCSSRPLATASLTLAISARVPSVLAYRLSAERK
jgi:hypothetical protein